MRRSHNPSLTHDPTRKKMVPPSQRPDSHHIVGEEHFSFLRFLACWRSRSYVSLLCFSKIFLRWAQTVERRRTISAPLSCVYLKDISKTSKNYRARTDNIVHSPERYFKDQHKLQSADGQDHHDGSLTRLACNLTSSAAGCGGEVSSSTSSSSTSPSSTSSSPSSSSSRAPPPSSSSRPIISNYQSLALEKRGLGSMAPNHNRLEVEYFYRNMNCCSENNCRQF